MNEPAMGKVGVALLGLGRWSEAHVAAATRSKLVDVVGCYSPERARQDAFASAHGVETRYGSFDEVLAAPEVEAVVLSVPNDLHVEMSMAARAAGVHVLVDKPVCVDIAEGLDLLRSVDATPHISVAHNARRLAGHRAQKAWIDSGAAGDVGFAWGTFSNSRGASMVGDHWYRGARGADAGVLIQVGIHQIDNVLWLLGPAAQVNAVFGFGVISSTMPHQATVTITHASGAVSVVSSGWTTPSHYRLDIQATGGNSEFWVDHRYWTAGDVDDHSELAMWPLGGERHIHPIADGGDPMRDQLDDLARAIRGGGSPGVSVLEGLRAMAVVRAAVQSAAGDGMAVLVKDLARSAGATHAEAGAIVGE
jgi:predicted dehydrogenase